VDAIKFLTRQHNEVEKLFKRCERAPEQARELFGRIERAIVPHAIIEEMHLYPLVRERVPGGDRLAEHALHEHKEVEDALERIGSLIADHAPFEITLKRVMDMVREHVREEEQPTGLFSRLRATMNQRELNELGKTLERSWQIAPTRAHPLAPDRPPANMVLGVPMAVVDRLRDRISGRAEKAEPAEKRVLRGPRKRRATGGKRKAARSTSRGGRRSTRRAAAKRAAPRRRKVAVRSRSRATKARRR
jgi:hypothetical protein